MDILKKVNRDNDLKKNVNHLINNINIIKQNKIIKDWSSDLEKITKLDLDIIQNNFSKTLFNNFHFSSNSYSKKIFSIINFFKYMFIYIFIFFFNFAHKKINKKKNEKYTLLIDSIMSADQIERYKKLINLYGKQNVLARTTNKDVKLNDINYIFYPKIFNYSLNRKEILKLLIFFIKNIKYCYKTKINFFYLSCRILNEYFWYNNFFEKFTFKYIIMHQHYLSNSIKNFVFKKKGGYKTTIIQKNINSCNTNGFFYDADTLFTFSKKAAIDANNTSSKINEIVESGSFFMENFSSNLNKNKINYLDDNLKFDIICFGGNGLTPGNSYYDAYNQYASDYNQHLDWLKKISLDYPKLKVGFKHHSNNKDSYEENYLNNSNVKILDKNLNSYALGLKSNFICSWASTMVIEMTAYKKYCYFLDPGSRNNQFLSQIINSHNLRIKDYQEFQKKYEEAKSSDFKNNAEPFCVDSAHVSEKIYNNLS